ncbi:MAG: glycosyltransferase family 1 protein [Candidatus Chloroheliales bacterium]|nr:MAG: glycosyltransferase family 1 protein [Chloroflexota bacterium]
MSNIAMLSVHTSPLAALGGKETGGMNVYVRDLSCALAALGHTVDVFTRWQDPTVPRVTNFAPGVRVIQIEAGPRGPYDKNRVYDHLDQFVKGVELFRRCNGNPNYDIIHAHYWLSGAVGVKLRKRWQWQQGKRVPLLQMFHTLGKLKNGIAQTPQELEVANRIAVEEQLGRQADMLIAPTPTERGYLAWEYNAPFGKIRIVPCGVDTAMFRPAAGERDAARDRLGLSRTARYALFVGRIERLKGIETLLRAVAQLKRNADPIGENIKLLIVGGDLDPSQQTTDDEMTRLHYLAAELDVCDRTAFLGAQPQERLRDYYNAADAVLMPSRYESFGMVAVEAMASGTPVIASRVGGLAHTVQDGETGYLLPHDDVPAWAGKLRLILSDDALRQWLGQQAAIQAQQFAWPHIATQIDTLYGEALQGEAIRKPSLRRRVQDAAGCLLDSLPVSKLVEPSLVVAGDLSCR